MNAIYFNDFKNSYIPHILKEVYIEKIYDRFFKGRKNMTVLDIGANIGLFTMFAVPYSKEIYAVEPAKEHFDVLKKNIDYNKWENVTPIKKALFYEDTQMELHHNPNVTMHSLNSKVADPELGTEGVEAIRLDTLFEQNDIEEVDFMKLDIEGAEVEVVGGEGFESVSNRIKSMVVEYHDWSGVNPSQLVTALRDYGFEVFPIPADAKLFGAVRK